MTTTPSEKWYITQQTFPQLLHRNRNRFGERLAQTWRCSNSGEIHTLSYEQFGRRVQEISAGLLSLGIQPGDRIAIMAPTSPKWIQADYAILCAAGITVCVYPSLTDRELIFLMNNSQSVGLFLDGQKTEEKALRVKPQCPSLKHMISMGFSASPVSHEEVTTLEALRGRGRAYLETQPRKWEERWKSVSLDDPMTIVYTSGTTGNPKGVVHTHFSFNAACRRDLAAIPLLTKEDLLLSFLPLAHTYERECGHGVAMHAALPIAYTTPSALLEDLSHFQPTFFMSVPRIYERIYMAMKEKASSSPAKKRLFQAAMTTGISLVNARSDEKGFVDMSEQSPLLDGAGLFLRLKYRLFDRLIFSKVRERLGGRFRFAFSAAGSLSPDLCKTYMAMGIRIFEGYGSTETCNTVNLNLPHAILPGSVGAPCLGVDARIAEDGEWQVKGDNLFTGYWNNKEATKIAFTSDGFYRTGDIVERASGKHIRIVDRKNGLLVLDTGKNVPSAKIESLFTLSPFVDTVVAFGSGKKFVSALVVPDFDALIPELLEKGESLRRDAWVFRDGICMEVDKNFTTHPHVQRCIEKEIEKANTLLEPHERIKAYTISHTRLSEARGELTPTLKVKRNVVWKHHEERLSALYQKPSVKKAPEATPIIS
ncbi:MAG: long-chain fatty acid--CoA ligase [Desulfobacterales bacterium]|nr:long-chain fatty acid--CoA ligase [Desulfobacterales bacterium]